VTLTACSVVRMVYIARSRYNYR